MNLFTSFNISSINWNYLTENLSFQSVEENFPSWQTLGIGLAASGLAIGTCYKLFWQKRTPRPFNTLDQIQIPEKFFIRLVVNQNFGFGDVVCGINTLKFLKKVCPNADILMVTDALKDAQTIAPPELKEFITHRIKEASLPELPTLVIQIPTLSKKIPFSLTQRMTLWKIGEYSFEGVSFNEPSFIGASSNQSKNVRNMQSGLRKNEMGIFINEKLRRFAERKRLLGPAAVLELKKEQLEKIEQPFLKSLLMERPNANLYYGYVFSFWTAYNFLMTCVAKEKENSTDIDVYIPSKRLLDSEFLRRLNCTVKHFKKEFIDAGVCDFELITAELKSESIEITKILDSETKEYEGDQNKGKKLRLIISDSISQRDVKRLNKASENFTCCTGDQSLSEAISSGKIFSYEMLSHKRFLFNGLNTIWKSMQNESPRLMERLKIPADEYDKELNYQDLGIQLNQPKTARDFANLSNKIAAENNFQLNLANEINRFVKQKV